MSRNIKDYVGFVQNLPNYFKSGAGFNRLLDIVTNKAKPQVKPKRIVDVVFQAWMNKHENFDLESQPQEVEKFELKPKISILVPVYKTPIDVLKLTVQSVLDQTYPYYELILADDNSGDEELKKYLESLQSNEKIKVVFRKENGGISEATNSAFKEATGEFIGLLDHDDELTPNALFEVVRAINEDPEVDIIYSDEDKIDEDDIRFTPHFKSDFAPDTLMSVNYICHFLVIRKSMIEGEFLRKEYDGAQDYDLILRLSEKTDNIVHIPMILYHWRETDESTSKDFNNKTYAIDSGKRALEAALERRGYKGRVVPTENGGFYQVKYDIINPDKKVSIIIPTKDNPGDIYTCVKSIVQYTTYPNYEIVIANNNSSKQETFDMFEKLSKEVENLKVVDIPIPFNFSRINNIAAREATGDFYLFLNDDTEVITEGWMTEMVGYAQLPWIGAVGAKLLYPDRTVQHGGVVVGLIGIAGNIYGRMPANENGYMRRLKSNYNYSAVTAACLMIEKDKFWQVGGFDENIAVAFNDVDLCCHLVSDGYYNIYLPDVQLIHYESKSRGYETTSEKILRFEKEKAMIRRKWRELLNHDPMYNPNLTLYRGDFYFDT